MKCMLSPKKGTSLALSYEPMLSALPVRFTVRALQVSINGKRALNSQDAAVMMRSRSTLDFTVIRIPPPPGGI